MKKNNLLLSLTSIAIAFNFSGCILPYNENFICNKGLNTGNCQSVSENYHDTFLNHDNIPLTVRQKDFLIEQLEEQDIINNTFFGKDKVLDWSQLSMLNKPRLAHILSYYSFDEETRVRIQKMINNDVSYSFDDSFNNTSDLQLSNNKTNFDGDEVLRYLRLENETLHEENLDLKTKKGLR